MKELSRYVTILGLSCLAAALPVQAEDGAEAREQAIGKAREESIRRQELVIRAEKMMRDADKLAKDKKYGDAATVYEQVLKLLPKGPATDKLYQSATRGAVDNRLHLAEADLRAKNFAGAKENAGKALVVDASNADAKAIAAKADRLSKEPEPTASDAITDPADDPKFLAKEAKIKRLNREARLAFESGQFEVAEVKLKDALALDPFNVETLRMVRKVDQAWQQIDDERRVAANEYRMRLSHEEWAPPARKDISVPIKGDESSAGLREKLDTERKLNAIVLPEVKFDGARIDSVIQFLVEESRRLDPDKKGVNIVLRLGEIGGAGGGGGVPSAPAPGLPPVPAAPAPDLPPIPGAEPLAPTPVAATTEAAPSAPPSPYPPITLNLRDIPLYDVLKLVTDLAGLRFRIERRSVVIVPLTAPAEGIISRVYPIQPGVFKTLVEIPTESSGEGISKLGSGVRSAKREDVKKFFVDAGVPFPAGASVSYNDRLSLLIVSNTPENLEIFERVIAQLNVIPSQVEIEAKFIELSIQNVNELGFRWHLGAWNFGGEKNNQYRAEGGSTTWPPNLPPNTGSVGNDEITRATRDVTSVLGASALDSLLGAGTLITPGASELFSLTGVLTDPQFQVVMRAVATDKKADLLSAPKVTTVSGNTAQIKVVREFRYPTEFTPPTATAAGGGTTGSGSVAVTPATPGGFETREVGVLLNVTPTVGPDGYTINLTLVPEVSDFEGFINYGSPGSIAAGNTVVPVNFVFNQPVFSSRQVTTTIQIWDGQTVVLGGLIREDIVKINDKVPFLGDVPLLGRLFRSKAEAKDKRNLLIFVTANLIDPAGNKIHKSQTLQPVDAPATPPAESAPPAGGAG